MSIYLYDVRMAVTIFPFVAILITLPILTWHYHKYGAITNWTIVMLYSFVLYLMCAYFLIMLPLPTRASVAKLTTIKYNLVPLTFVGEFLKYNPLRLSDTSTWIPALKNASFIQPVFNIFLTVPLGMYLHYYFHRSWKQTLAFSFCLSLFFELTQLSGLYGIYPRPYRLFDVDDLLLNSLGGLLGAGIATLISPLLPSKERINASIKENTQRISIFRHAAAFFLDWGAILILTIISTVLLDQRGLPLVWMIFTWVIIWLIIPELIWQRTLGMKIIHLKITDHNADTLKRRRILWRNFLGYGWLFGLLFLMTIIDDLLTNSVHKQLATLIFLGLALVFLTIWAVDLLIYLFRPQHELFFEKWSRTELSSTIH